MNRNDQPAMLIFVAVVFLIAVLARRRWNRRRQLLERPAGHPIVSLKLQGMLGNVGLVIGRTMSGKLIRVHELLPLLW